MGLAACQNNHVDLIQLVLLHYLMLAFISNTIILLDLFARNFIKKENSMFSFTRSMRSIIISGEYGHYSGEFSEVDCSYKSEYYGR